MESGSSELGNARFLTIDATRLPFGDNEFDIVATNKVTHHVPARKALLPEMVRVLKPVGYFLYADLVCPAGWPRSAGSWIAATRGSPQ